MTMTMTMTMMMMMMTMMMMMMMKMTRRDEGCWWGARATTWTRAREGRYCRSRALRPERLSGLCALQGSLAARARARAALEST